MSNVIKSVKVIVDTDSYYMGRETNPLLANCDKLTKEDIAETQEEIEKIDYEQIYKEKMDALEKEKEMILEKAHADAELIIQEANNAKENIAEEAKMQGISIGKEEGYESGYKEGYNEAKAIIDEALNIKSTSMANTDQYIQSIESEVVNLVIDSIKKVVDIIREEDKELVIKLIGLGLSKITSSEHLILKVSNEDLEIVREHKNNILALYPRIEEIEVKEDFSLNKGDCIIVTESGDVDARLETQLPTLEGLFRSYIANE